MRDFDNQKLVLKTEHEQELKILKDKLEQEKSAAASELRLRLEAEKEDLVQLFNVDKLSANMVQVSSLCSEFLRTAQCLKIYVEKKK